MVEREADKTRLVFAEALLRFLQDERASPQRARAFETAAKLVEGTVDTSEVDDPAAIERVRAKLAQHVEDERRLVEADASQRLGASGAAARPTGDPVSRARKAVADASKKPGDREFEKQHPRARTGRWMEKGAGMAEGEQPDWRVKELQQRLTQLGFKLDHDGRFGGVTEAAVKEFQSQYGLEPTGKVDEITVETLRNPPPKTADQARREVAEMENPKKGASAAASRPRSTSTSASTSSSSAAAKPEQGDDVVDEEGELVRKGSGGHEGARVDEAHVAERKRTLDPRPGSRDHSTATPDTTPDATPDTTRTASGAKSDETSASSGLIRRGDGMLGKPDSTVQQLQQQLADLGYELGDGGVDGKFGEDTEAAIRLLQRRYGLRVDGVVGPQTRSLIERLQRKRKENAKNPLTVDQEADRLKEAGMFDPELHPRDADGTFEGEELVEASYKGVGPSPNFGTRVTFGGIAGALPTGESGGVAVAPGPRKGPVGWGEGEDIFGQRPPTTPPNLREATEGKFPRCSTCVHFNGQRLCAAFSAGVDDDDLCDAWLTLTPSDFQRLVTNAAEAYARMTEADAGELERARHEVARTRELVEAAVPQLDPMFGHRVETLMAKGIPGDAAEKRAAGVLTRQRVEQARRGVVGHQLLPTDLLVEAETQDSPLRHESAPWGYEDRRDAYWLTEATFTEERRKKLAAKGQAMPHGGFPIENTSQLKDAIQAYGRAKNKAAAKRHIIRRAKALGATSMLPSGWLQESVDTLFEITQPPLELVEVDSRSLPDIPNKPNKTNWVEKAGGLPKYIERVAKHLRSEKGYTTSRAIATAVNHAKKMCSSGRAFGGKVKVSAKAQAVACAAVADWEKKKGKAKLTEAEELVEAAAASGDVVWLTLEESVALHEEMELHEAAHPLTVSFDPALHPRNRMGQFRDVLGALQRASRGAEVNLPGGVSVRRRSGEKLSVYQGGKKIKTGGGLDEIARKALTLAGSGPGDDQTHMGLQTGRYRIAADKLDPGSGSFADRVGGLAVGKTATTPEGVTVRRSGENEWRVIEPPMHGFSGATQVFRDAPGAARNAEGVSTGIRGKSEHVTNAEALRGARQRRGDTDLSKAMSAAWAHTYSTEPVPDDPDAVLLALNDRLLQTSGHGRRSRMIAAKDALLAAQGKETTGGVEGPFTYRSGWQGRYDPKEGRYLGMDDVYMPRDFDPESGRTFGEKADPGIRGPRADDRQGQSDAARQSAATARSRAAELRGAGNEEHAKDYDEMAERFDARAARLGGEKADPGDRERRASLHSGPSALFRHSAEHAIRRGLESDSSVERGRAQSAQRVLEMIDSGELSARPTDLRDALERMNRVDSPTSGSVNNAMLEVVQGLALGRLPRDRRVTKERQARERGEKSDPGVPPYPRTDLDRALVAWAEGKGEKPMYTSHGQEQRAKKHVQLNAPFKGTHTYRPGVMDLASPNVIEGRPIARGAHVRIVEKKVDPHGMIVHVQDDQGNIQSVWKKGLQRGTKKLQEATFQELAAVITKDAPAALRSSAALAHLAETDSDAISRCRLEVAEFLVESAGWATEEGAVLRGELRRRLEEVTSKDEAERRLVEARGARGAARQDPVALSRAQAKVRLQETLVAALS